MRLAFFALLSLVFCPLLAFSNEQLYRYVVAGSGLGLAPAMFQVYSAEDIGFRWDLPLDGENIHYDIQNKVVSMICILF
jgi:hypothetical protein